MLRIEQSPLKLINEITNIPEGQLYEAVATVVKQHLDRAEPDAAYPRTVGAMQVYLCTAISEIRLLRRQYKLASGYAEYWERIATELRKHGGMTEAEFDEMLCDMAEENSQTAEVPIAAG